MKEFITEYWLEVLFGLICAAVGFVAKRYKTLYDESKKSKKNEFWTEVRGEITNDHKVLEEKINQRTAESLDRFDKVCAQISQTNTNLETLKEGILSVQGKEFKEDCRQLLDTKHEITLSEFEDISVEHNVYNKLGGNHDGDNLYELVEAKFKKNM